MTDSYPKFLAIPGYDEIQEVIVVGTKRIYGEDLYEIVDPRSAEMPPGNVTVAVSYVHFTREDAKQFLVASAVKLLARAKEDVIKAEVHLDRVKEL